MAKQKLPTGIKFDKGKLDWTLMPWDALEEVLKILEFGKKKYARDNWKAVTPKRRYISAGMRHLRAYMRNWKRDKESGINHLAHAICCMLFLLWFDLDGMGKNEREDLRLSFENLFPKPHEDMKWHKSKELYICKEEPDIAEQYTRDLDMWRAGITFSKTAH